MSSHRPPAVGSARAASSPSGSTDAWKWARSAGVMYLEGGRGGGQRVERWWRNGENVVVLGSHQRAREGWAQVPPWGSSIRFFFSPFAPRSLYSTRASLYASVLTSPGPPPRRSHLCSAWGRTTGPGWRGRPARAPSEGAAREAGSGSTPAPRRNGRRRGSGPPPCPDGCKRTKARAGSPGRAARERSAVGEGGCRKKRKKKKEKQVSAAGLEEAPRARARASPFVPPNTRIRESRCSRSPTGCGWVRGRHGRAGCARGGKSTSRSLQRAEPRLEMFSSPSRPLLSLLLSPAPPAQSLCKQVPRVSP